VRRYAISTCYRSAEVVRCQACIAASRSDPLTVVEELEDR
jgi:hypothetical protein